ncbi:hypothetical protein J6590_026705 [Homalodisca vitripennis]|nr:hypothetical protein J6590_026705 [Homalodisca vitripennis]
MSKKFLLVQHGNPSRITDVQAVNGPSGTVKSSRSGTSLLQHKNVETTGKFTVNRFLPFNDHVMSRAANISYSLYGYPLRIGAHFKK